jgi:hypothetical protein
MTHQEFWTLIERAKNMSEGDPDEQVDLVRASLVRLAPKEIVEFDEVYEHYRNLSYRRELWGAAFLINGGCSDDGFEYFRAWLISRGKKVFERAMENPDSLASEIDPESDGHELEEFIGVAKGAYEEKLEREMPERKRTAVELTGKEWTEAGLEALYPKIAARMKARA